jgi:hypothetical protein
MKIHSESVIRHAPEKVFATYRDRLPEMAPLLPSIKRIDVANRTEQGPVVTLHNIWYGDQEIPAVAAAFVKPEQLCWDDFATWDASAMTCAWEIRPRAFTAAVSCRGKNRFEAHGEHTRFVMTGDLDIKLDSLPGVPGFMVRRIVPKVEEFILALLRPNFEKTAEAVGRFLDQAG